MRPRIVASRLSTECIIKLTFSLHLPRVRFYNVSKNTIAHSNNCNLVELETERKVQFSHFLQFLNVYIDMYYLHQSAYYLYKANDSASILASLKHSTTESMKKLCDPAQAILPTSSDGDAGHNNETWAWTQEKCDISAFLASLHWHLCTSCCSKCK